MHGNSEQNRPFLKASLLDRQGRCAGQGVTLLRSNYSRAVIVSPFLHLPNVFVVSAEAVAETIFPEG